MERLDVYLCNQPVGTLTRSDAGDLSFQYLPVYLESNAIPLSSTLPLDTAPFKERDIAAFFSNLLPDESVRLKIADILRLTPEDTFGLLRLIGGDCAGAVAFYEPGKSPAMATQPAYRELSSSEAAALLSDLSNRPLGIGEKAVRDSITRQIAALRKNLPTLSDLAESTHPSPVYQDIIQGIHTRIRQLEQTGSAKP